MASSDEEGEILPQYVTNYHFVDHNDEPVSFSTLPLQWNGAEILDDLKMQVYLHGTCDDGLQKIYKRVIAWKVELSYVQPAILVLSKDRNWITLQSPRKWFKNIIRTALTAVYSLHFLKKNPEASGKFLWNHLLKTFSSFEVQPSENDLLDHMPLIRKAVKGDKDLENSKYLLTFMGNPQINVAFHEDVRTTKNTEFIVDEDEDEDGGGDEEDKKEESPFDPVCAICDNGGQVLCCEGRCLRSFHATIPAGIDTLCESLGYTDDAQVEELPNFLCKNCLYQQHQCFVCGILGSSDKSSGQEVFPCASATCGHFYHPQCVAKLLHADNETQREKLRDKIAAGESFTCPIHKCFVCKQSEDKNVHDLRFAICRRCPKAYHRKCLPRRIAFEFNCDENNLPRAWTGLLPNNRILIYCMAHKIIRELGTPVRDHLIFPDVGVKKSKQTAEMLLIKEKAVASKRSMIFENFPEDRIARKKLKRIEKVCSGVEGGAMKKIEKRHGQDFEPLKKTNVNDVGRKLLKDNINSESYKSFTADKSKLSLRNNNSSVNLGTCPNKFKKQNMGSSKIKNTISDKPVMEKVNSSKPSVDAEMGKKIVALMKDSTSSFNVEEFMKRYEIPATHECGSRNALDKTITLGLVEGSVKAVRTALQRLQDGCSIEDAKTVCDPEILKQIFKWKRKLKVYLAPVLHGNRYTSFGRHFTKVEKLEEIVDRLHWYVQSGDMIVDFCCGSNDFSCLLKEKLEETGKSCLFKNYDLMPPKNDFNFERRDWMSVTLDELPEGSRLIMGLNPPFGVKASLANAFIRKALQFRPKLIVLIVPKETKSVDAKAPYNLVWEDDNVLAGKSFYLPGSVDVHDKKLEQWNTNAPPLYLWSRSDWTARHKAIAQEHRHIPKEQVVTHGEEKRVQNFLMEENYDCYGDFSGVMRGCGDISSILDDIPEDDETQPEGIRPAVPGKDRGSHFPVYGRGEG